MVAVMLNFLPVAVVGLSLAKGSERHCGMRRAVE